MSTKKNNLIFIPCYNCAQQIPRVINNLPENLFSNSDILIVDNLSTDETLKNAFQSIKKSVFHKNFHLYRNKENYGLGGSFKKAFQFARENNYKYFGLLHGDNQANSSDLLKMIEKSAVETQTDIFFGSRFSENSIRVNYSTTRLWANKILNQLTSILTLQKVEEIGSGLNLFKVSALPESFIMSLPDHIAFDLRILLYTLENNLKYQFFPIHWKSEDEETTINDFSVGLDVIYELLGWRFNWIKTQKTESHRPWEKITDEP